MHDFRETAAEKKAESERLLKEMSDRVARRPKLFQQVGIDTAVERAKQVGCLVTE